MALYKPTLEGFLVKKGRKIEINQWDVCRPAEKCNEQRAKPERGKNLLQISRRTNDGRSRTVCHHPTHQL